MKLINDINIYIGLWLAVVYIFIFHTLTQGGYLWVLHYIEAYIEMGIAILVTLWFAWQIPYRLIKRKKAT